MISSEEMLPEETSRGYDKLMHWKDRGRLCLLTFPGFVDGLELLFSLIDSCGLKTRRRSHTKLPFQ